VGKRGVRMEPEEMGPLALDHEVVQCGRRLPCVRPASGLRCGLRDCMAVCQCVISRFLSRSLCAD
jgi:hypothetical protein